MNPRLALYLAALAAALLLGPHGPVYWDSYGYLAQSLTGRVGGLALGRPLFVLASHLLYLCLHGAGLSLRWLEPALRTAWLAVAATAAPATHALALRCRLSSRAALLAGLCVALSPAMAHTSSAVLTDAPSVALALWAFVLGARSVGDEPALSVRKRLGAAFAAGCALGAAFGLREQAIAQGVVLALLVPCAPARERVRVAAAMLGGLVLVAGAPLAYVVATQRGYGDSVVGWVHAMQRERAGKAYGVRDALAYAGWVLALGPAAVVFAAIAWVREWRALAARWSVALAVCVPALVQLALLARYQDIAYSPRYLLPALPGAVAIPAGLALAYWSERSRQRAVMAWALVVLPVVMAAAVVRPRQDALRALLDETEVRMASVPGGSVVVAGQACPELTWLEARARRERGASAPRWQRVCPGWGWPEDLSARLERARREDSLVVVDLREGAWIGRGQLASRAELERYLAAHGDEVRAGGVRVWR